MRKLSDVFKALSDETRLQMLGLALEFGELCVCDFMEVLGISQSKASRHLRYLVNAGLVSDRREAVWVYYRIADTPGPEAAAVLGFLPDAIAPYKPMLKAAMDAWRSRKIEGAACVTPKKPASFDEIEDKP